MKMTFDNFHKEVMDAAEQRPRHIRYGQAVFNFIDEKYGVAREVQINQGKDCFYDDTMVDEFIEASFTLLKFLTEK